MENNKIVVSSIELNKLLNKCDLGDLGFKNGCLFFGEMDITAHSSRGDFVFVINEQQVITLRQITKILPEQPITISFDEFNGLVGIYGVF